MEKSSGISLPLFKGDTPRNWIIRYTFYFLGLMLIGLGIAFTIKVKHLGLHPWDVISVALFQKFGLSIGTWTVLLGIVLIIIALLIRGKHVNIGTFMNAIIIGPILDFYFWLDFLPRPSHSAVDYLWLLVGILIMGTGGGLNVAGKIGAGPRDGFMLTVSERTGFSVRKARIVVELLIIVVGYLLGGPVFFVTFLYTFIQSPVFQFSLKMFSRLRKELSQPNDKPEVCVNSSKGTRLHKSTQL